MDQPNSSKNKYIYILTPVVLFFLAIIPRWFMALPMFFGDATFPQGDDVDYYRLAISFLETGALSNGHWLAYRMPLFPLFLSGIYLIFGRAPQNAYPVMVILAALIPVLTYFLGLNVFNLKVGLLAGVICALDMHLIYYSDFLLTEPLYVFLVLAGMIAFEKLRISYAWQWAVIAGILFGLANLTRTTLAFSLPFPLDFSNLGGSRPAAGSISKFAHHPWGGRHAVGSVGIQKYDAIKCIRAFNNTKWTCLLWSIQ